MKNKVSKLFALIFSFALVLYLIPGCGSGGSSGGGGDESPAKASSGSSGKKPIVSFKGHVDVKSGTITFEYPDENKKVSGKKLYSSPGNITLVGDASWSGVTKILQANI